MSTTHDPKESFGRIRLEKAGYRNPTTAQCLAAAEAFNREDLDAIMRATR